MKKKILFFVNALLLVHNAYPYNYFKKYKPFKKYNYYQSYKPYKISRRYSSYFFDTSDHIIARLQIGLNSMHLKNEYFKQAPLYIAQYKYFSSTFFPSLLGSIELRSKKKFNFLKKEWKLVCGLNTQISHTSKKITGIATFKDIEESSAYVIRHDFNIKSINPYMGILFLGEKINTTIAIGIEGYNNPLRSAYICENQSDYPYIGLKLQPLNSLGGNVTFTLEKKCNEHFVYGISYKYTRLKQSYDYTIVTEAPTNQANVIWQDFHTIVKNLQFMESPTFHVSLHTISFTCGYAW